MRRATRRRARWPTSSPGPTCSSACPVRGVLTPRDGRRRWRRDPIVFALANPNPEILPDAGARRSRPTRSSPPGRSDFPNQVNNVLCFPFIFRGALDVGATEINDAMQTRLHRRDRGAGARLHQRRGGGGLSGRAADASGRDYLIPKPFDPRLIGVVASAVAEAAMETGVATRPIADLGRLPRQAERVGLPLGASSCGRSSRRRAVGSRRIVFAEGEDERVLRAAHAMIEETRRQADPDRSARRDRARAASAPACRSGRIATSELVNPENDPRYRDYWDDLSRADGAARRDPGRRPRGDAHQHHRHRRGDGAPRRGRQPDLRHLRPVPVAPELRPPGARPGRAARRSGRCR